MKKNFFDSENAPAFDTKEACQQWIDKRVMRFKCVFTLSHGAGLQIDKREGRVVDTTAEGYTKGAFDEPLARIAKPVRDGAVWRAVIPVVD